MTSKMVNEEQKLAVLSSLTTGVIHPYVMNNANAKKKLLQNASKDPITPGNVSYQSTMVSLSTGAFKETVLHLLSHWSRLIEEQQNLQLTVPQGQHTVFLVTMRDDGDKVGNKTDALVSFKYDDIEIKLHVYYTNQSLMVHGPSHGSFYSDFLLPILTDLCSRKAQEIKDFNCLTIRTLKPGSLPEGCDDSVWRSSTPNRQNTLKMKRCEDKCDECGKMFVNKSRLKVHKSNTHGVNVALKSKPRTSIMSTRSILTFTDNSQHAQVRRQQMMNEATSILESNTTEDNIEDALSLEEESLGSTMVPVEASTPLPNPTLGALTLSSPSLGVVSSSLPSLSQQSDQDSVVRQEEQDPLLVKTPSLAASTPPTSGAEGPPPPSNLAPVIPQQTPLVSQKEVASLAPMEKNPEGPLEEAHPSTVDTTAPLEVIVLSKSQVIPELAWTKALNKSIGQDESVKIVNVQDDTDEIEEVEQEQPFQCAVCDKCFEDQESVDSHFEIHGNAHSVISLMKRMYGLESTWRRRFDEQESLVVSLQHQVNFLQTSYSRQATSARLYNNPPTTTKSHSSSYSSLPPLSPAAPTLSPASPAPQQQQQQGRQQQSLAFRPAPRPKGKTSVLYLADSVSSSVAFPVLEAATGSVIKTKKAYSSEYDERAHKPTQNVNAVLREQLKERGKVHTVVLGSPTMDISNQYINNGLTEDNVIEVVASACNMMEAAEYALKSGQAEQVVLLQHPPRYDTAEEDPEEVRPRLARMANEKLKQARDASQWAEQILVGEHTDLECEGRTRINRFTSDHTFSRNKNVRMGKFDGVHLYSQEGANALTTSIQAILGLAGLAKAVSREKRSVPTPAWQRQQHQEQQQEQQQEQKQEYISPWLVAPASRGFLGNARREEREEQQQFQLPTTNRFSGFY